MCLHIISFQEEHNATSTGFSILINLCFCFLCIFVCDYFLCTSYILWMELHSIDVLPHQFLFPIVSNIF